MTPFEKVMGVYKQASVLIARASHGWTETEGKYAGAGYWYSGYFTGVTIEAAQELCELFQAQDYNTCFRVGHNVTVKCFMDGAEKEQVNALEDYGYTL